MWKPEVDRHFNSSSGNWQVSRVNPAPYEECGIDVALMLDLSNSIPDVTQVRSAVNKIVDGLVGTPSRVSLFSFSRQSPADGATNYPNLMPVATSSQAQNVKNLYSSWGTSAGTNWDAGFSAVATSASNYDAVVVLTDGGPTVNRESSASSSTVRSTNRDVEYGIFSANAVKAKGTRVVAMGVGGGISGSDAAQNLIAISGPVQNSDYFQTSDFTQAANQIVQMGQAACSGNITVTKQLVPLGGTKSNATLAGPGWTFTATAQTSGVTVAPGSATTVNDETSTVSFDVSLPSGTTQSAVTVTEQQQAGYQIFQVSGKNAECRNLNTGAALTVTNVGANGFSVTALSDAAVGCTVYNTPPPPSTSCEANTVFNVDASSGELYKITGGTATRLLDPPNDVSDTFEGVGVSQDGSTFWVLESNSAGSVEIFRWRSGDTNWQPFPSGGGVHTITSGVKATGGAVAPDGAYWFGAFSGSNYQLWRVDPNTGALTSEGSLALGTVSSPSGDFAFDARGNLHLGQYDATGGARFASVPAAELIATDATLTATFTGWRPMPKVFEGIAFDNDGSVFTASSDKTIQKRVSTTWAGTELGVFDGDRDLASCQTPPTITLAKNVVTRVRSTDQFTLSLVGSGSNIASVTTTGTATGVQAQQVGPVVMMNIGNYTLSETASGTNNTLTSYQTTYECRIPQTGTVLTSGTGASFSLTLGASSTTGPEVVCTFTNRLPSAALTLVKGFDIRYGAPSNPSAWVLTANALQFASGQTQDVPPSTYTIGEVAKPGYELYSIACTLNGTQSTTSLASPTIALNAGDVATCTLTNRDLPGQATWLKSNSAGTALSGSEWELTGPRGTTIVVDNGAGDTDPAEGAIAVAGLAWGEYELFEVKPPTGFQLTTELWNFVVTDVSLANSKPQAFVNSPVTLPALPLTGASTQLVVWLTGLLLVLALLGVAGWTQFRQKP
ncbi:VWA domain-containing protein [Tessaracoccus sp. OS52]|nr:VWA domain-containing protein [Tessaracoccus sp. OS52]